MDLELLTFDGTDTLGGHGHSRLHICIVRAGGFAERRNQSWRDCGPGTVRVSPAKEHHDLSLDPGGLRCGVIELPESLLRGLRRPLDQSVYLTGPWIQSVAPGIIEAWNHGDRFAAESAALELVARAVSPTRTDQPPHWLPEFRSELLCNANEAYSLSMMSNRIQRHRSHVSRTFREWYGRSPGAYLRAHRLAIGAQRLSETTQPIADLACELGFTDQAHFSRHFRLHFGIPPAAYRTSSNRHQN